jgi:aryl-alcohol dehydrogenase-like predicted oxidoreductase
MLLPRPFGSTGLSVSPLCLGTVKLGRDQQVKYPQPFTIPDDNAARELLSLARELGINCLDTAPAYGRSEERLGQLLGKATRDWVICTKVGEEFNDGHSHFDFSPEHVRYSVERSLKRLHRDELDIVLIHSDGNDRHILRECGTLDALADLKQKGLVRAIGMSTKTVEGGLEALKKADAVMVTYHLTETAEEDTLDAAHEAHKGVFIKKAFASGHLCTQPGTDPAETALRFVLAHPGVSSVTIGTINPAHLRANVEAAIRAIAAGS